MKAATFSLVLALAACGGGASETELMLSQLPSELPPSATAVVWVWGYDDNVQDASASLVGSFLGEISASGALAIPLPDDPEAMIDQGFGPVSSADSKFYFSVYVDVNGDDQICPDVDLGQDYAATPIIFFTDLPSELVVAVRLYTGACQSVVPELSGGDDDV
jgi:hypothetical protein